MANEDWKKELVTEWQREVDEATQDLLNSEAVNDLIDSKLEELIRLAHPSFWEPMKVVRSQKVWQAMPHEQRDAFVNEARRLALQALANKLHQHEQDARAVPK